MKVSDFEIDFSSGLFTCCWEDVLQRKDENTYEGHIISCEECGEEMILRKNSDGVLKWTHT
jgi:hypothetical protein